MVVVTSAIGAALWLRPAPDLREIRTLVSRREWAQAERKLLQLLRHQTKNAEALLLLARLRNQRNDPDGAIECLRRIDASSTVKPQSLWEESEIHWKFHRAAAAERCWRQIVEEDARAATPNARRSQWVFWSLARLGDLLLLESRDDEARQVLWQLFESVDRRDGAAVDFLVQLTVFDLESESPTVGLVALQPLVEADPTDVQARRAIASYYLRMGETAPAAEILRVLMQEAPLAPGVYETWVQLLVSTGDHAAARRALAEVPGQLPVTATLWKLRGVDHENQGEFQQAVDCYRQAIKLAPRSQGLNARLAQALRAAGRRDLFEQHNERVTRTSFVLTELSGYLGKFARRPGNSLGAEQCLQLARLCEQLGWWREAKAWHELIVARQPDAPDSRQAIRHLEKKLTSAAGDPGAIP